MLSGKGFWTWQIRNCENGNADMIGAQAEQAGLSHVMIKICDGVSTYNIVNGTDLALLAALALKFRHIEVWVWQYVYGWNPVGEADAMIRRIQGLLAKGVQIAGIVVNAEKEYKGNPAGARIYMTRLRNAFPSMLVGLSTYRFVSYHLDFPFEAFLEKCDIGMPQVYWIGAHNPGDQLARSVREWRALHPIRPIIPTGAAWKEGTWVPTVADIGQFLAKAKHELGLTAANFWSWDACRVPQPALWQAVKSFPWGATPPPPPEPEPEPEPAPRAFTMRVMQAGLRVRSQPNTDAAELARLDVGQKVQVLDIGGVSAWVKIPETDDHPAGWANVQDGADRNMEPF